MYDSNLIRNLILKLCMDGEYTICETCSHKDEDSKSCIYETKGECTDNLERYVPNKEIINS